MHETQLENVDLNLLPALSALLDEQQISRAAERSGLSQSAMSRALQRLRRALGDDLLVRVPGGYRLTARAERVREQLRAVVPQLNEIFTAEAFDPAAAALSLQVSGSDYALATLGLELSRLIVAQSPQSTLRFRPWHEGIFDELALGAVDVAFFGAQAPAGLRSRELFRDRFVCVVADDHPLADRTALSLPEYLQCRHLAIDITDGRQPAVDHALAARGTPRDVALIVPFHAVAPRALPGTMLVLTFPERLAGHFVDTSKTRILEAPPEIETMTYRMAWHPRVDTDPAHRWLRDSVQAAAAVMVAPD